VIVLDGPRSRIVLEPRDGEPPAWRRWGPPLPAMQAESVAIFHVTAA
jgi:hypothetical protein